MRVSLLLGVAGAALAAGQTGSQSAPKPRAHLVVCVSTEEISSTLRKKLEGGGRSAKELGEFFVSQLDKDLSLAIPRTDPVAELQTMEKAWNQLTDHLANQNDLSSISLPKGEGGKQVTDLLRVNAPKLGGLNDPSVKVSVSSSFQVGVKGNSKSGVFWQPQMERPPAGPVSEGKSPGGAVRSLIDEHRTTKAKPLNIFVSAIKQTEPDASVRVGKAIGAYYQFAAEQKKAADLAYRKLYETLLAKQKGLDFYKLTHGDRSLSELPKGIQSAIKDELSAEYKQYGFGSATDALRAFEKSPVNVRPYLSFSVAYRESNGQVAIFQMSIPAPAYRPPNP